MTKIAYKPYKTVYKNIKLMVGDMQILWFEKINQIIDAMVADKCFGENDEYNPRGKNIDNITSIENLKKTLENLASMVELKTIDMDKVAPSYFEGVFEFFDCK